ncbi:MAG: AAA family ATPase, partial [candidate division WOR-3 bacterium]
MLSFLKIKNFALMESLEIEFGPGLIVLTGETGAGKSIIIQALSALLGQKMDETVIRTGSESAEVEGLFKIDRGSIDRLRSAGIETEGEIIIKRVIGRGRRQSSYINNSLASISLLKEIGERLVDLHGQHEHQSLLNVANHIDLLDSYGGLEPERLALAQTLNQYQSTIRELEETVTEVNLIKTKIDLLQYQIDEIKKAQLKPGEDEELRKERDLISSAARRAELSEELIKLLYEEENSILTRLEIALKLLNQLTALDPSLGELNNEAEKTKIQLAEIHRTIFNYHSKIDLSRERLDEVNGRLDLIARLKKKYGSTIEEILNYYEKI